MKKLVLFWGIILPFNAFTQCNFFANYPLTGNANDLSSNALHGTVTSATLTNDRFGNSNSAYAFSGGTNYIELAHDFDFSQRTINIWFKAESSSTTPKHIYDSDHPGMINSSTKMWVWTNGGIPKVGMSTGSGSTNQHNEPINLNQWYMGTIVVGSNVKFYLNAQLIATFSINPGCAVAGNSTALIGSSRLIDRFFDGDIDDLSIYNCALDQNSIDSLFNISNANCSSTAEFDFNGNTNDISGNGNDGISFGATLTTDRDGNSNQAYLFNGTSDYIEVNNNNAVITNSSEFSITGWAKMNGVGGGVDVQNTLFVQRTDATGNGNPGFALHLENSSGNLSFGGRGDGGGAAQSVSVPAMPYGSYHHYAAILDNTVMKLYVDGVEVASAPFVPDGNVASSVDYVFIGKNRYLGFDAGFFNGVIDEVQIFNCALSASEVLDLYNLGDTLAPPASCVSIAEYPFTGNAADSSGNSLDGTNNGAALTTDRFGNLNSAYSFDGAGDYIEFPSDFDTPERSINVWFKADQITTSPKHIYDSDHPGMINSSTKMWVWIQSGQAKVGMSTGTGSTNQYNEPINANQWYMGTIVVGNDVKFYLNSNLISTFNLHTGCSTSGNMTALIGSSRLIDRFFDGDIDDISIFDCAISQNQIDSLYNNFVPIVNASCLKGDYYFSGNADDVSGNGNDGTTNDVVLTTDLFGNPNSAYSFNDSTSYIDLNSDYDFSSRTINLWFKANDIDTTVQHLYDSDHPLLNNGSTKMWLIEDSAGTRLGYSTGNGGVNRHYENVNENQWYMSSISVSPTQVTYYLNGQPIHSDVFNAGSSTSGYDQSLLGTSRLFDRYFDGVIDNVSIYECEMSAFFIDSLFQLGSAAIQPLDCDLLANSTVTPPSCFGGANAGIDILVTSNIGLVSYSWSTGSTASALNNIPAGNYSVFITDTIGCDTTILFTINNPDEILITSTVVEPDCNTNEGEIDITVTNAASPYSITWSTGDTTSLTDSIPAGLYYVEIIDANGCQGSLSVSLNNSNSMSLTDTTISNTMCPYGNTGSIDITLTGGTSPFSYTWSNGATTEDVSNLSSGLHDVLVMDDNGCVLSSTFEVVSPSPFNYSFTIQPSFCNSSNGAALINVFGATSPYSYQWITGASTSSVTGLAVGYYSVTVTDDNGCSFTDIAIINEFGGPQIATDTLIQPSCGGNDGQVEISVYAGVPPFTYDWSDNSTAQDLMGVSNGTYSVIVTGSNGCSSVNVFDLEGTTPDSIEICIISVDSATQRNLIIWEKPVTTDIDHFNIYKETSTANVFNLVGNVHYDSLSVFLDSTANPQVRGWRYKLTAVDLCGNESMQSQFHKTLHLNANVGVGGVINLDWDEYTGFPYGTFYIWRYHPSTDWMIIDSIPSNLFAYTDIGGPVGNVDYYIEVRKSSGCDPSRSGEVSSRSNTRTQNSTGNSIEENQKDILNIYPNPATDLLYAELTSGKLNARFDILDVSGKLVYSGTLSSQPISIKELSRGLYTIHVILENENYIQKFIKN